MERIDFVIPWVDGDDPVWKAEKDRYEQVWIPAVARSEKQEPMDGDHDENADCRYRELGLLRYWFRSVEQFAPWVGKIFFVTCGQKPAWLKEDHPKLVLVDHKDFIPAQYLPTFCSNTIELNFHRIDGLSEHFVYFNDDNFLLRPVQPEFFFREGNPIILSSLRYPNNVGINNWSHHLFNDYCLVNSHHDIGKSIWKNRRKWFNAKELSGHRAMRNFLCYLANKSLPVCNYEHLAHPHLKSTIADVWEKCPADLDHACSFKFRSDEQVNQWLFLAWNQALGKFFPCSQGRRGRRFRIAPEEIDFICHTIEAQTIPQVCLNDTHVNTDPVGCAERIISSFERILPHKSAFELD